MKQYELLSEKSFQRAGYEHIDMANKVLENLKEFLSKNIILGDDIIQVDFKLYGAKDNK